MEFNEILGIKQWEREREREKFENKINKSMKFSFKRGEKWPKIGIVFVYFCFC